MSEQTGYSVLVMDLFHWQDPEHEYVVSGFPSVEAARAYAEALVRDSVEHLRSPGMAPGDLRAQWTMFGENCLVLGDGFSGRDRLDFYVANPATPAERDWKALEPRQG